MIGTVPKYADAQVRVGSLARTAVGLHTPTAVAPPVPVNVRAPMVGEGVLSAAISAAVVGVIGALASFLVERAWRRHKSRQQKPEDQG
jgi:hypothetical protein